MAIVRDWHSKSANYFLVFPFNEMRSLPTGVIFCEMLLDPGKFLALCKDMYLFMQATRVEIGNASIQFERGCHGVICDNNSQRCVYIPWIKTMVCNFRHPTPESADSITMWLSRLMMTSPKGKKIRVTGPLRGNPPVTVGFPSQRPVTRSFDIFFYLP